MNWNSIAAHHNVFWFACSLFPQPEIFLEVIYAGLMAFLKLFPTDKLDPSLLRQLQRELSDLSQFELFDVFHNKYFNHTTTDNPKVYVPSQFYVFDSNTPEREAITFHVDESKVDSVAEAQCCLHATSKDSLNNILKVLLKLQKHVKVITTCLIVKEATSETQSMKCTETDRETKLLKRAIKLSHDTLTFCMKNCYLSQSVFKYIVKQLHSCNQLESLSLVGIQQMIPANLG